MNPRTDHETFELTAEGEWQEIFSESELDELSAWSGSPPGEAVG